MFNNLKLKGELSGMATIANRIKTLRKEAGMTQEELGAILGVVKSTISLYESGKSVPGDDIKKKLCEQFNVTMDFLIGITDSTSYRYDGDMEYLFSFEGNSAFSLLVKRRGSNLGDLSEKTGIPEKDLEQWFTSFVPSIKELVLIADELNTSVDYLLCRTSHSDPISEEEDEFFSYFEKLSKMDKLWIVGQMIDLIKQYHTSVAADEDSDVRQAK